MCARRASPRLAHRCCLRHQGDAGNEFFVVDEGTPEVFVSKVKGEEPVKAIAYSRGDSFGEVRAVRVSLRPRAGAHACG